MEEVIPYPSYKESNEPWIGKIPAKWKLVRMKYLFRERNEKGYPKEPLLAATQNKGVVRKESYEGRTVVAQKDLHLLKLVCVGDFVISLRSFQGGIEYAFHRGIISPAYTVLIPTSQIYHLYFSFLFKSLLYIDNLKLFVTGIREGQNIDYPKLSRSLLPLPEYDEQVLIARFLRHYDQLTQRYMLEKQQQIKLLNDQKQSIIQNAVFGGIDSSIRHKPSNIQWVGDIPEHWNVISNRRLFRENTRMKRDGTELRFSLSQRDGLIATSEMKERSLLAASHENFKVCLPGDLILNRFKAHLGVFFAAWARGIVTYHYGVYEPLVELRTKYFEYLFHTVPYRTIYAGASNGMTVGLQNLSNQNFYKIKSIVPPLSEQDQILAYIEEHTATINTAQETLQKQINAVKEYHSKLIADVITGKLDVREAAKNLPEIENLDIPESAPIEDLELSDELEDAEEIEDANE